MHSLSPDVILHLTTFLSLQDALSLSLVCKSYYALTEEHSFWLYPLRTAQCTRFPACPSYEDLAKRSKADLKQLSLHTRRLDRHWREPVVQILLPTPSFQCSFSDVVLCCLPGAETAVLSSPQHRTLVCRDVNTGLTSPPVCIGMIVVDTTPPLEVPGGWTVALLLSPDPLATLGAAFFGQVPPHHEIVVLRATVHPVLSLKIIFRHDLELSFSYLRIFMTNSIVGVVRGSLGGPGPESIQVQSYNIIDSEITTVVTTDCPYREEDIRLATAAGDDVVCVLVFQSSAQAAVYACPRDMLADTLPPLHDDYSIFRSHVARILHPPGDPESQLTRTDHGVLSSDSTHGAAIVSIANVFEPGLNPGQVIPHSVEVTFWPRPKAGTQLRPASTVAIPGELSSILEGTRDAAIAASGRAVVLLVEPPPRSEDDIFLPPKLMLVRYDPFDGATSVHELHLPLDSCGQPEPAPRAITTLAVDDRRGCVIAMTGGILHKLPYV